MPSNADLIEQITEAAAERGVDAVTADKNNKELVDELARVRALPVKDDPPPPAPAAAPPAAAKPKGGATVAPGKSITSRRGILDAGEAVKPADLGVDKIGKDHPLVRSGYLQL